MGYRSDVGIKCRQKAFERFYAAWNEHDFKPDRIMYDEKNIEYLLIWEWVKYYEAYEGVRAIESVMSNLDDMAEADIEEVDGYGYKFLRIGEDVEDVESRTNNYNVELWMRRELDLAPEWRELDV